MATTPNYSWPTPDDTDLVKDGAEAIRDLGDAIDATVFANSPGLVHINTTTFRAAPSTWYSVCSWHVSQKRPPHRTPARTHQGVAPTPPASFPRQLLSQAHRWCGSAKLAHQGHAASMSHHPR